MQTSNPLHLEKLKGIIAEWTDNDFDLLNEEKKKKHKDFFTEC